MNIFLKPHQRPRYLRFQYKPRFWDPQKERVEQLKARIRARNGENSEKEINKELLKERVRRGLHKGRSTAKFERRSIVKTETRKSNLRLLVILIAILWIAYKLLTVYL